MKDYKFDFKVDQQQYTMIFNLNVMQEIQEEFGSIKKWGELTDGTAGEVNVKALIFGLMAMINESIEIDNDEKEQNVPLLTRKQVGRLISKVGIDKATHQVNQAFIEGTKSDSLKNE